IDDWRFMAARFGRDPRVIGAELRNEIRPAFGVEPTWGGGDPRTDWKAAAERAGDAVLSIAPHWLVFVGGLSWSTDFGGVWDRPARLAIPNRLVYAPHDYAWFHPELGLLGYDGPPGSMKDRLGRAWGFILKQ